ncbi:MAG: beta strand repeat-containing protein, partial [Planctomycetaceae bacterium]
MTIRNLLQSLRKLSTRPQFFRKPLRKKIRRAAQSIPAESLEDRALLAACLFVDWGDNFPGGTLSTTLAGLRDVYDNADDTQDILGPQLESDLGYNPGTSLNIVRQTFSAADRAAMMATVVRAYRPLDIYVIDLTSTPQPTPDGRIVTAATNMTDVVNTLRSGPPGSKDAYVFVSRFVADPGGPNEKIYGPSGGGTSPVNGLDTSDLNAALNQHDDVAVVFTDSSFGYNFNTMNNIAHEAGHNFGLQHSLTNSSGNAATDLLHLSEVTSYLNTNSTTSSIAFSRYPVIRGDDNSPDPGPLVNYNDLEARTGDLTPWDQLRTDPFVGPNPSYTFISGTGAHDVIEITRSGATADVRVTAYADAARTVPIIVPFVGGNTWSYTISLTQPILVFAGASNDLIRINGDLGVPVEVDGMIGIDEVVIDTVSGLAATWTPNTTAPAGVDQLNYSGGAPVLNYGGTIEWGTTFVSLQNFEPTGEIRFLNTSNIMINGSTGSDQFTVNYAGSEVDVSAVVSGTPAIPITALNPTPILINGSLETDTLTWNATGTKNITGPGNGTLSAPPLSPISFTSMEIVQPGSGNFLSDILNLGVSSLTALGSQDNQPNQIIVQRDSSGAYFEVLIDFDMLAGPGPAVFSRQPYSGVSSFQLMGGTDADLLTVNHANGVVQQTIAFSGNAPFNSGEPGGDALSVTGTPTGGFGMLARETYLVGVTEDAGSWILDPDGNMGPGAGLPANGDEMIVNFDGLEPVDTDIPVPLFDVVWNNSTADNIRIEDGGLLPGGVSLRVVDVSGTFETFRFANKNTVRLHLNGGADIATLNYSTPAAGLANLEVYGHGDPAVAGLVPEDNAPDRFAAIANSSGVGTTLYGQGGSDRLNNFLAIAPAGSSSLALINGPITFVGGETPADNDEVLLTNAARLSAPVVTLNSFALSGAAPALISWSGIETFAYGGTQASDTIDILSTAAETSYAVYTNDGADDVVTIGNTRAAFDTPTFTGSLTTILGSILVAHDHAPNAGPDSLDILNIDASGDAALAGTGVIGSIGLSGFLLDGFLDVAPTTRLTGFAPATIDYQHGTNSLGNPGDRLEVLEVRASRGVDNLRVIDTTASVYTRIDAREGNDTMLINGDNLSANNLFQGFDGNDDFSLLISTHIGNSGVVSPTTSVRIEGNGNPIADSANRDRLTVVDGNAGFSRAVNYDFLNTPGDLDILASTLNAGLFGPEDGGLLGLNVRSMETLRFDSTGPADDRVTVTGRSTDDDLTVAFAPNLAGQLTSSGSAFVFLNGNPYTAFPGPIIPPDSLAGNLPGRAGGGDGIDLLINGISPVSGLLLDGNGATVTGNRAVIQGLSENSLIDPVAQLAGLDIFNLGLAAGVLTVGAGTGNAFDALAFNGATAADPDMGGFTSAADQITGRNIASGPLVPVTLNSTSFINGTGPVIRPGLIVNGGDEAGSRPSGIADNLFVTPHSQFSIAINGNLPALNGLAADGFPAGDQLSMSSPESFSIWSDKASPPHVTIAAGNSPYTPILSSIERTRLYPGNGTINLIGDQNNPSVDQTDTFRVLGVDIDPGGSADGGVQEMAISINASASILVDGLNRLNVFGFDLTGQNLNNPNPQALDTPVGSAAANVDTLELTPFADNAGGPGGNAPRGWGVQTLFNEGTPASADGDPSDLLIVHTAIGVSTGLNVFGGGVTSDDIVLQPSGPDNGEVRIRSGVDGSTTAVVAWIGNTDIIVVDDDGAVSDTDRLFINGTDPGTPQVSGNDTFQVNFSAAGTVADPMVTVRDADSGRLLYRLRGFQAPMGSPGPLHSIAFDMLGGDDSMTILNAAVPGPGGTTAPHVTVWGGSDDDSVTVQWPSAAGLVPGHLTWDGGAGQDSLSFNDPPESPVPVRTVVYTPGPIPGSGRTAHTLGNGPGIVDFMGLEPVFDFTNAAAVTVNAGNASNSISYYTDYGVGTLGPIINGGTYLSDGLYLNVQLTGGSGSGARADITVAGGAVVNVALTADGANYTLGDVLTAPAASLGGGPGGFSIPVASHSGTVAVDNQEILVFANKSSLILNGEGGSDHFSLNNPITPAGLTSITVNGGDPTGSDSLLVNGRSGVFDNILVTPTGTGSGSVTAITAGFVPVLFNSTEELRIVDAITDSEQLNFIATAAADTFTWHPGTSADAGRMLGQAVGGPAFAFVPVTWAGITGAIVAGTGTGDTLVINGTSGDDLFAVSARSTPASIPATYPGFSLTAGGVQFTPVFSGNFVSSDQVVLSGLAGNDTFRLNFNPLSSSGQLTPIRIEGGESGQFSDSAEFLPVTNAFTTIDLSASTITSSFANPVTFTGLEALAVTGWDGSQDAFAVNGLGAPGGLSLLSLNAGDTAGADDGDTIDVTLGSGPDTLDYTPLSPSSALLQRRGGSTQLRVVSLNAQIGDLTVAGGGSVDQLNVITPAGNNRIDIQRAGNFAAVTVVNGGNPSGGTAWVPVDFSLIAGPATFNNLQVQGNASDDLLRVDNSGGLLTLPGGITFDGSSGRDSLQLIGSTAVSTAEYSVGPNAGDGRIVHTVTGPPLQVQTITFSGLEPLIDLVAATSLTVNATEGSNAISHAVGPNSGVVSSLNPLGLNTGRVTIDGFEPVEFAGKLALNLRGLGGSDQFSLSPTAPAALTSITVDGGAPTAGSDTAIISGSAGADTFRVAVTGSDTAIITGAGTVPITLTTTESLHLNGQGGADSLRWVSPADPNPNIVRFVPGGVESAGSITAAASTGGQLLPISFSNIPVTGAAANLIFDDADGVRADWLTIEGTAASDLVQVTSGGVVSIRSLQNARVSPVVDASLINRLTLQTLAGDDQVSMPGNLPAY